MGWDPKVAKAKFSNSFEQSIQTPVQAALIDYFIISSSAKYKSMTHFPENKIKMLIIISVDQPFE